MQYFPILSIKPNISTVPRRFFLIAQFHLHSSGRISIPGALVPMRAGRDRGEIGERPGHLLLGAGSVISPTAGTSLTRGVYWASYSSGSFFLIECFTSYFVFSIYIAVLPHTPGVVYYHLLLRRETRIPEVAPFSYANRNLGSFCA